MSYWSLIESRNTRLTPFRDPIRCTIDEPVGNLLYWALMFLIVALVAAALGFGGVAGTAMAGAKLLFWVAIVLFVIALIGGLQAGGGERTRSRRCAWASNSA
jgi:uncharacterized membrane protein YtjA (UPF0391 family)